MKKTILWVGTGAIGLVSIVALASGVPSSPATSAAAIQAIPHLQTISADASQPTQTQEVVSTTTTLSNNNYYTNVDGNSVHSPAYSSNGEPDGATAECRDGTYSFSQHHSGTCSHHGGVSEWL